MALNIKCPQCDQTVLSPDIGPTVCKNCGWGLETTMERLEERRQQYLIELAKIIEEEGLTSVAATQLMFAEIASWLMVIAHSIKGKQDG